MIRFVKAVWWVHECWAYYTLFLYVGNINPHPYHRHSASAIPPNAWLRLGKAEGRNAFALLFIFFPRNCASLNTLVTYDIQCLHSH